MAVGEHDISGLGSVAGVRLSAVAAGIKQAGRLDLVLFELAPGCTTAAVFTQNAFCAAPVTVAREARAGALNTRYLLVNTGNANAGTGQAGLTDARDCCTELARLGAVAAEQVLPFSTGVIGEPLPIQKIIAALPAAIKSLDEDNWQVAARGILTTDTRPKAFSESFNAGGNSYTVTGIAKGSGMIRPNMATMLAYIATDAAVDQALLQTMLEAAVQRSFNRVSIDGDTSTNDALVRPAPN